MYTLWKSKMHPNVASVFIPEPLFYPQILEPSFSSPSSFKVDIQIFVIKTWQLIPSGFFSSFKRADHKLLNMYKNK